MTSRGYFEELLSTLARSNHTQRRCGIPSRRAASNGRQFSAHRNLSTSSSQSESPLESEPVVKLQDASTSSSLPRQPQQLEKPSFLHRRTKIKPLKRDVVAYEQATLASYYSLTVKPALSSYAALGARMHLPASMKANLALIEQACTCPSFWEEVEEHQIDLEELYRSQKEGLTYFCDQGKKDNTELVALGNELLGMLATEWVESKWPHLPHSVLKAVVTMYVGPNSCADVARIWGIRAGTASLTDRYSTSNNPRDWVSGLPPSLKGKSTRGVDEGRKEGTGVLRWSRRETAEQQRKQDRTMGYRFEDAMACTAKAFVGAIFQESGFEACRSFVRSHFFSRSADVAALLKFDDPNKVLTYTMKKYELGFPDIRLLKETGRASMSPLFVVGIFTPSINSSRPNTKLGEALGSSLKMASYRAAEDALRRIYLAKGTSSVVPSDSLLGEWTLRENASYLGDDEVQASSSGKTGKMSKVLMQPAWAERDRVRGLLQLTD